MSKKSTPFLDTQRKNISQEEYDRANEPYHQQQELMAFLQRAYDHSVEVLKSAQEKYGYTIPSLEPGHLFCFPQGVTELDIEEYEIAIAIDTVKAVIDVKTKLFDDDKHALANAAIWLGTLACDDIRISYLTRIASGGRESPRKKEARAIYNKFKQAGKILNWNTLRIELGKKEVFAPEGTIKGWLTEFRKGN